MEKLQRYFDAIEAELSKIEYAAEPDGLYAPVRYELSLGGKRVRPLLTLLACEMFAGDYRRALNAAVGLEVFHNFTLLHDDVMDKADVRRGKPTVHKVWDENTFGRCYGDHRFPLYRPHGSSAHGGRRRVVLENGS